MALCPTYPIVLTELLLFLAGERLGHDDGDSRPRSEKTNQEERARGPAAGHQEVSGGGCEAFDGQTLMELQAWGVDVDNPFKSTALRPLRFISTVIEPN